jgi:hypothetical protein
MFINTETQEWPISEHAIRASNLNISFTEEFVPPYPFMQVKATIPSKTFNRVTHTIEQSTPECVDGEYFQTWKVVPKYKTKEEEDEAIASHLKSVVEGKLSEINSMREKANYDSFTYNGKQVSCSALSRSDIDGVTNYVALFNSFPHKWKCIDNTFIPIETVDDWKVFVSTMVEQGTKNFLHSQYLKQLVAGCTTAEEVNAIKWED